MSLYDGGQTIHNIGSATVNYLREPGSGEMLMESWNGNGPIQNNVPLLDGSGSTVAMVDVTSGNVVTNYNYDPLGSTAVTVVNGGTGYKTAYQYHGMENDSWAYRAGNSYYSPIMGRSLSSTGPLIAPGGYDSGLAGAISAAMPGSSGSPGLSDSAAAGLGAGTFAAYSAGAVIEQIIANDFIVASANPSFIVPAVVVAVSVEAIYQILDLFGVFGGGHTFVPYITRFELTYQGGSLQRWDQINGQYQEWAPPQSPVGRVQAIAGSASGPQFENPTPPQMFNNEFTIKGMGFLACEGLAAGLTIDTTLACGVNVGICASTLAGDPLGPGGCGAALGPCAVVGSYSALCYATIHHLKIPKAPHEP